MNIIKRLVPCFTIKDSNIKILADPNEFYQFLKLKASACKKRIVVASLYLGTTELETAFIDSVFNSVKNNLKNKDFRVHFLFDSNRGSRPVINACGEQKSSRTMCLPLLASLNNVKISFYHTPNLRGYLQRLLPNRINEVIGLQHMKVYLFDDCLIVSGANLSTDYFTNRQDRYMVFENSPELCDFYEELVEVVGTMSYHMTKENELIPPQCGCDPINGNFNEYISKFREAIDGFIVRQMVKSTERERSSKNTRTEGLTKVFPLIQMGLYQVHQDQNVLRKLFTHIGSCKTEKYSVALASGYFNLDDENERLILNLAQNDVPVQVLSAHQEANGFFQAKGSSGYIPDVYNDILQRFLHKSQGLKIDTFEWKREQWTFHAKGFWISREGGCGDGGDGGEAVTMTLIGSTNYGYRSCYRDLESEILVHTESAQLQEQLGREKERLFQYGVCAQKTLAEKVVPYWIHWVVPMVKYFF